ncbi:leucine-rich repeat domain-containing protein [Paenibacillus sanguinis]|uniref:leucine-rich repeat domain-containing protein n=1 Tax=Paenibacillus sanguinis TaxID=225906 RepID=UPI0003609BBC|nr:leucine-rich repeat domain-containing protein [Paenibacillus sanguinis]
MGLIQLKCPNCGGQINQKNDDMFQCPFCNTELIMKKNHVYHVDQTINNYYGTTPAKVRSTLNTKWIAVLVLVIMAGFLAYIFFNSATSVRQEEVRVTAVRTIPESQVLLSFVQQILDKGKAQPTTEDLARISSLSVQYIDNQWHFTYSLQDPSTNGSSAPQVYVMQDKQLNTQRIEQKDFEAFIGLTSLELNNTYEINKSESLSLAHLQHLKSFGGSFNESFQQAAAYLGDKSRVQSLTTQIRSNAELALLLDFKNLHSLNLTYVDESVTDFHLLGQLPLDSLTVTGLDNLNWIGAMTDLKSLAIEYSEATDFNALYGLTALEELRLRFDSNLKTLDFVANMPALQLLELTNSDISSLEALRDKKSLTRVYLSSVHQLDQVDVLNTLPSLKELSLQGYYGKAAELQLTHLTKAELPIAFVAQLDAPALLSLTVNASDKKMPLSLLRSFPKLEHLTISEAYPLVDIPALNQLKNMHTLVLHDMFFAEGVDELFALQQVTTLDCNECVFTLDEKNPIANSTLEQLRLTKPSFRVDGEYINEVDKVLPYFAGLTSLRSFSMQDSVMQSLAFMEGWQQIEELHLENNAITDLQPLIQLSNLKKLYLTGNPVRNASVLSEDVHVY